MPARRKNTARAHKQRPNLDTGSTAVQHPIEALKEEETLSADEVAAICGTTETVVKQWMYRRKLPATKVANGHWRIRRIDLEQFLKGQTQQLQEIILAGASGRLAGLIEQAGALLQRPVIVARNLPDSILKAHASPPSLMILDPEWPGAFQLAERVTQSKLLRRAHILFVAEKELSAEQVEWALSVQARGCVVAPASPEVLASEIRQHQQRG